eukprot:9474893-Pyramimonas_sp.AAC.1
MHLTAATIIAASITTSITITRTCPSSWSVVPSRDGGWSLRVSLPVFAASGHGWAVWAGAPPQTQVRARAQRGLALGGRPQ